MLLTKSMYALIIKRCIAPPIGNAPCLELHGYMIIGHGSTESDGKRLEELAVA